MPQYSAVCRYKRQECYDIQCIHNVKTSRLKLYGVDTPTPFAHNFPHVSPNVLPFECKKQPEPPNLASLQGSAVRLAVGLLGHPLGDDSIRATQCSHAAIHASCESACSQAACSQEVKVQVPKAQARTFQQRLHGDHGTKRRQGESGEKNKKQGTKTEQGASPRKGTRTSAKDRS